MKKIRIGGALGFWGDRADAVLDLLQGGPLDYVIMDYLAEVTMSILQKQRMRDPGLGYPQDFVPLMKQVLPLLHRRGVRLVTDAGGLNPLGLADMIVSIAREAGFPEFKVGVVYGDDLMPRLESLGASGIDFMHFETGAPQKDIPGKVLSANAYFGAFPIAAALDGGADIVLTGRVNDAALALGPMIHEFGWKPEDYDLLARGTMAGHLIECGGQASGGNYNGGWPDVPDLANLGFPIAEIDEEGTLVMTIHPGQGGLLTPAVVKEQLLYEIGDPSAYVVADVTCDITVLEMEDLGENRVLVRGTRGQAPPASYKVSMTYDGGYQIAVGLAYAWPECVRKARASADLILQRLDKLGIRYRDLLVSVFGHDGLHGGMSHPVEDPNEAYLRMAFAVDDVQTANKISREVTNHVLCGIPTGCMIQPGRPKPHKQIAYWPSRIAKSLAHPQVQMRGGKE
jgi:hypothetical protein